MQVFGAAQNYIDFLIIHTYPIYDQTYYTYSSSNPNFQASPSLELLSARDCQALPAPWCMLAPDHGFDGTCVPARSCAPATI